MPKENDLEGQQDQGGKHGGQQGVPKSEPWPGPDADPDDGDIATPKSLPSTDDDRPLD